MDRRIPDALLLPAAPPPCRLARVQTLCRPLVDRHILTRRCPDSFECSAPQKPVPYSRFLEQQNREDRAAAKRLEFCPSCPPPPPCPPCPSPARPHQPVPRPRGDERPHQDPHRPQGPRIGDVLPPPPPPPHAPRAADRQPPLPRLGRLIDLLI